MTKSIEYLSIKPVSRHAGSGYNVAFRVGEKSIKISDVPKNIMYGDEDLNMECLSNFLKLLKQLNVTVVEELGGYGDEDDVTLKVCGEAQEFEFHTNDLKTSLITYIFNEVKNLTNQGEDPHP